MVGAGTVLNVENVQRTRDAGGRLIVSPNIRTEVIRCALQLGLDVMPGMRALHEARLVRK